MVYWKESEMLHRSGAEWNGGGNRKNLPFKKEVCSYYEVMRASVLSISIYIIEISEHWITYILNCAKLLFLGKHQ